MSRLDHFLIHASKRFFIFLFLFIVLLTVLRQKIFTNFKCEVCSDKAGYYMFLPAAFQMGFRADNYPEGFDIQHGLGFHIDRTQNKVVTKFTCGVAILLTPFYVTGILIANFFSIRASPYSEYYIFFINIGAAFYAALGLYYLMKFLSLYVKKKNALLTVLIIFFGTNLYYYTLDESLMSHLYSFTLLSLILYGSKSYYESKKRKYFYLLAASLSFAILIRPTNIFFGIIAILIDIKDTRDFKNRIALLCTLKNFISGILIFAIIILPQLCYWKFAFGKYIVWSYEGEGFTFWNDPQFMIVWFSPQGGLFPYTPVLILSLLFSFMMLLKKYPNGLLIITTFFVTSYLCAAWSNPYFGYCNFGKRPMVDYLPLLMMPVAFLTEHYYQYTRLIRYAIIISIVALVYYNQALFAAFNTCFPGSTWDWNNFLVLLENAATVIIIK